MDTYAYFRVGLFTVTLPNKNPYFSYPLSRYFSLFPDTYLPNGHLRLSPRRFILQVTTCQICNRGFLDCIYLLTAIAVFLRVKWKTAICYGQNLAKVTCQIIWSTAIVVFMRVEWKIKRFLLYKPKTSKKFSNFRHVTVWGCYSVKSHVTGKFLKIKNPPSCVSHTPPPPEKFSAWWSGL